MRGVWKTGSLKTEICPRTSVCNGGGDDVDTGGGGGDGDGESGAVTGVSSLSSPACQNLERIWQ